MIFLIFAQLDFANASDLGENCNFSGAECR